MNRKTFSSFFKELWRNPLSRYSLLLALVGLLIFLALPVGSKYFLRQWLLDNGADTATIGKIRINPFTGRISLADVSVTRNGQTVLTNSTVKVNIGLRALFDREALLQKATLTDTVIEIERYGDGSLRVGSYRISPQAEQPVREEEVPWVFRAREVGFSEVLIRYLDSGLRLDLFIEEGTAQRFTTDPQGKAGRLALEGTLNEAPLTLHLSVLRVNPDLDMEGRLDCSGFPLASLAGLFGDRLTGLSGRLRAETGLVLNFGENGLVTTFKGKIGLAGVEIGGNGWTGAGELALDGGLGYSSSPEPRVAVDGLLIARPVSLAMPERQLHLGRTEATVKGQTSIGFGKAVTVRSDAEFSIAGAAFRLAETAVKAGPGTWNGTVDFSSGEGGEPMRLTTDGGIELQELLLAMPGPLELNKKRLTAKGTTSIVGGEHLRAGFSGNIELAATGVRSGSLAIEGEEFSWQGDAAYAGPGPSLQLKGAVKAGNPAVSLPGADLRVSAASLAVGGDASLAFGGGPSYTGTSDLTAADLQVARGGSTLAEIGRVAAGPLAGDGGRLSIEAVVTENVILPQSEAMPVRVSFDRGGLQGAVADETLSAIAFRELTVDNLAVADGRGVTLAAAAVLAAENGTVRDLAAIGAESLRLDNGAFLYGLGGMPQQPLATAAGASGAPFSWSQAQGTRIGEVAVDSLVVRYRRSPSAQAPGKAEPGPDSRKNEPIPLGIGSLHAGGDSALYFVDPTVDPEFQTTVAVTSLKLADIDLNKPEQAISFALEAMVDKYAPLSLRGSLAPLASPFRLKAAGSLQNLSLNSLSPYAVDALGIALQSGQLDLTTDMSVNGERLDSDNRLQIKNIEISRKDAERARSLEAGLPVPLEMAIDMLSDRQGVISVSVPVNGKLSELRVGIQDVVVTALSKALTEGIVPALAYTALGPTGALAYLGMKIGGALLDTELPSLQFAPNRSDLSAGQQALLDKVGQGLQRKMQDGSTTYSICPKVVPGETAGGGGTSALTDEERRRELYRLGEQRAQAVKQYLVQNFNLNPDRLFICNPTLSYGESARGTVEFRK